MTPLDNLTSLPAVTKYLRADVTLHALHALARTQSDVQAATALNVARLALFKRISARAA